MRTQILLATGGRPARQDNTSRGSGEQVNARAPAGGHAERGLLGEHVDQLDDPDGIGFDLSEKDGLSGAGCQPAHGGQRQSSQAAAANVGLRQIVDTRAQQIASVAVQLDHPALLHGAGELRQAIALFARREQIEHLKCAINHRCRYWRTARSSRQDFGFVVPNYRFFHANNIV